MALSETPAITAVDVHKDDLSSNKKDIISTYESICIKESKVVDVGNKTVYNGKVTINYIVCPVADVENCETTPKVDSMYERSSREKLLSETDSKYINEQCLVYTSEINVLLFFHSLVKKKVHYLYNKCQINGYSFLLGFLIKNVEIKT